jgi:LuxR family maltose regulon positive regulatory protein
VYADCFTGALHLMQGRLKEALGCYRSAYARVKGVLPGYSVIGAVAAIFLGEALYELDEIEEAERVLKECRDLFPECMPLDVILIGYVTLAKVHVAKGEQGRAATLHAEAERISRERGVPRGAATIHLEQIRMSLQRGDLKAAEAAADCPEDREVWKSFEGWARLANDVETPDVSTLRLMIRRGDAGKALPRIKSELERAEGSLRHRRALRLRILLAEALSATGEKRGALRVLREALQFGSREGYVRAFADEGGALIELVRDIREAGEAGGSGYAEYLDRILAVVGDAPAPPLGSKAAPDDWPFEALTDREIEIIRMAASGDSNQSLADKLFVSVPTIKYHLRNINMKLNSANRTEAIAKARRFGLIA